MDNSHIVIFDTTLRDGEQSPGATMTLQEKIAIATRLDAMGVDVIEAGFAAASPGDLECILAVSNAVKQSSVCSLARAMRPDIEAAARSLKNAKKPRIHTFISTSDIHIEHQFKKTREQILEIIDDTVRYAKSMCGDVEWSAMDATRSDMEYLVKAVDIAVKAGAMTINIPDTVGYAVPEDYLKMIGALVAKFPDVRFSTHCHNDLGLAVANSLAGVKAGARQVECTINGIGERAGNAAMEEIVMAIKTRPDYFQCQTNIDTKKIYATSRFVASVTGFPIQKNKAIVGANAFAHESGIHQDGMLKNRNTYEIMLPESVGIFQSQLVLGKHSGRAALKSKLAEWHIDMQDNEFNHTFEAFKALCDRKKNVTEEDLLTMINEQRKAASHHFTTLVAFSVKQKNATMFDAEVTLQIDKQMMQGAGGGNNAFDALFQAIKQASKCPASVMSFEIHGVSENNAPQAEATVTLAHGGLFHNGHARDLDAVTAAARAYVVALNKILSQNPAAKKTGAA